MHRHFHCVLQFHPKENSNPRSQDGLCVGNRIAQDAKHASGRHFAASLMVNFTQSDIAPCLVAASEEHIMSPQQPQAFLNFSHTYRVWGSKDGSPQPGVGLTKRIPRPCKDAHQGGPEDGQQDMWDCRLRHGHLLQKLPHHLPLKVTFGNGLPARQIALHTPRFGSIANSLARRVPK